MRTEEEMYALIFNFARENEHVKAVMLEGSRTNIHVKKDEFQDYDITFLVDGLEYFTGSDVWLETFGKRLIMQKPEDMELFEPEIIGFSYLMLFEDYNKMDLTLVPVSQLSEYLGSDKLMKVLLDKEGIIHQEIIPSDEDYHIRKPTERIFGDCCNEFWNVTPYIVKGLCRGEYLFAADHLNEILRKELLRMLGWEIGTRYGFDFSLGKNCKWIDRYLQKQVWQDLQKTFRMDSSDAIWDSMFLCHRLFREAAGMAAERLGYEYPDYDEKVSGYCAVMFKRYSEDQSS